MNKILIIGLGSIGRRHTENFTKFFNQIDIVDIKQDRIDQARNEYKINESFTDYSEALNKNRYDVVAITTPPHMHLPIAELALSKNSHLFIEKPLGMSIDGWETLIDIAQQKNKIVYIAYCHRHINYSKRLKEMIESNSIGRPIHANVRWGSYLPDRHPYEDYRSFYMAKKEQGGGALLDESHGIDMVRYILGDVKDVFAIVDNISDLEITSDDAAFITLRMKSNALVHINFDLAARAPRINFEIIGTQGTIIWDRMKSKIDIFDSNKGKWETENFTVEDTLDMYPNQASYFIDCIKRELEPSTNLIDAIETQKVIDASFKSSETGKLINL